MQGAVMRQAHLRIIYCSSEFSSLGTSGSLNDSSQVRQLSGTAGLKVGVIVTSKTQST